jgi:hypothetical protein
MNTIKYRGQSVDGRSPDLWHDCPILGILEDPSLGYGFFDDFLDVETVATTKETSHGYVFLDAACTVIQAPDEVGGAIKLLTTDNNLEASVQRGFVGAPYVIAANQANGKKLWFEARVKLLLITTAKAGFFVGLAEEGSAAAAFMGDAGALSDFANKDYLGFWKDEDEVDLDVITNKATTDVILAADVHTLVADTYVKLGFKYDPDAIPSKRIKFYVNGTELSTYVGETANDGSTIYTRDTTNFPGGEEMSPIIDLNGAHDDDTNLYMDWWSCYQLR